MNDRQADDKPLSFREMLGSIFAAAIGVQSETKRERDFRRGSAPYYIVMGIAATILFVVVVYAGVKLVLALAT